jgi:hypothetical protein
MQVSVAAAASGDDASTRSTQACFCGQSLSASTHSKGLGQWKRKIEETLQKALGKMKDAVRRR